MRKTYLAAALLATTALVGCDNNPDVPFPPGTSPPPPTTMMSVLEFARALIGSSSCETSTPAEINGRTLDDNETALTDLGAVSAGCSG